MGNLATKRALFYEAVESAELGLKQRDKLYAYVEELEAENELLKDSVPTPEDLNRVVILAMRELGSTENLMDFACVARVAGTLPEPKGRES